MESKFIKTTIALSIASCIFNGFIFGANPKATNAKSVDKKASQANTQKATTAQNTPSNRVKSNMNNKINTGGGKQFVSGGIEQTIGYKKDVFVNGMPKEMLVGTYMQYVNTYGAYKKSLLQVHGEYDSNGNRIGVWQYYTYQIPLYINREEEYKNGKLYKERYYDKDGYLTNEIIKNEKGNDDIALKRYYDTGKIFMERDVKNDTNKIYYPNGKLYVEYAYKTTDKIYAMDGTIVAERNYQNKEQNGIYDTLLDDDSYISFDIDKAKDSLQNISINDMAFKYVFKKREENYDFGDLEWTKTYRCVGEVYDPRDDNINDGEEVRAFKAYYGENKAKMLKSVECELISKEDN